MVVHHNHPYNVSLSLTFHSTIVVEKIYIFNIIERVFEHTHLLLMYTYMNTNFDNGAAHAYLLKKGILKDFWKWRQNHLFSLVLNS